jgi:poly-gamma-glutamate capsule biosynthesis protein CapA/YwtB (metallophosphatase superfamily)
VALCLLAGLILLFVLVSDVGRSDKPLTDAQVRQLREQLAEQREPVRFTVSVSGDLLIHSPLWAQALENGGGAYDFAPFFAAVRPWIAGADLALCHLETPLTTGEPASYPVFATPDELADAVRAAGWDGCSTASNHSLDGGQEGIDTTARELDRRGLSHTGSFSSPRDRDRVTLFEVDGVKVGLVAYTDMTNGIPLPDPWSANVAPADDPLRSRAEPILADADRARAAGAEAVIVNMHWGDENSLEPNSSQLELARRLTRSPDVTVVVGQGPHVVQPIRRINGKFVVFSEGNLVSNQSPLAGLPAETQDGLIALLDFVADGEDARVERVRYLPTWVRIDDYAVLPAFPGADPAYADSLRDSWERTVATAGRGRGIVPLGPRR